MEGEENQINARVGMLIMEWEKQERRRRKKRDNQNELICVCVHWLFFSLEK